MKENITGLDYLLSRLNKVRNLSSLASISRNWHDVILLRSGLKKEITLRLKSGHEFRVRGMRELMELWSGPEVQMEFFRQMGKTVRINGNYVSFNFNGRRVTFYSTGGQMGHTLALIREMYIKELERYERIGIKGKTVVDVGANIGDSPIFFALNSAKHVYAFEPFPYPYSMAVRNIRLNKLSGRITMLNEGLGGVNKRVMVSNSYKSTPSSRLEDTGKGRSVRVSTLEEVVRRYKLSNAFLKMDCEGAEYEIIRSAPAKVLRKFDHILISYHYGYVDIKDKLEEAGFRVTCTRPTHYNGFGTNSRSVYGGILYAVQR